MIVTEVSLSDCSIGSIVANDICNQKGVNLLTKNTAINEYIKEKLLDLGINKVKIFCDETSPIYFDNQVTTAFEHTMVVMKDIINDISSGKPIELDKIKGSSEFIYNLSSNSGSVIRCLQDVRNCDEYTYSHCVETAFYCMLIAKWLDLSITDVKKAIESGLLHDIGKTKIPIEILNKKGALSDKEYKIIKEHPILGYKLLNNSGDNVDHEVKVAVLLHHERLDSLGYPFKASPQKINTLAKIVAIADVYDAMTNDRVYKKRSSPFEVFKMFLTDGLRFFDIKILSTFIKNIAPFYTGSRVMLNNLQTAVIVYIPPQDVVNPIIQIGNHYVDLSSNKDIKILYMI